MAVNSYDNLFENLIINKKDKKFLETFNHFIMIQAPKHEIEEYNKLSLSIKNMTILMGNKTNEEFMKGREIVKLQTSEKISPETIQTYAKQKEIIIENFIKYLGPIKRIYFFQLESMKPSENFYKELTAEFSSEVVDEFIRESLNSIQ